MPGYLVDSNVLLDIITADPAWLEWSARQLGLCRKKGDLIVNPIIVAEISPAFDTADQLENWLDGLPFERQDLPWKTAFLAGHAFLRYREKGGQKRSPLPDFYIGAHAMVSNLILLTRDAGRYQTYFPSLKIVAPNRS